mgnify:FL=1
MAGLKQLFPGITGGDTVIGELWRRYLFVIGGILVIFVVRHFLTMQALHEAERYATSIERASEQRALSQQVLLLTYRYHLTGDPALKADELATVTRFEDAHRALVSAGEGNAQIMKAYVGEHHAVQTQVEALVQAARACLAMPPDPDHAEGVWDSLSAPDLEAALDAGILAFETAAFSDAQRVRRINQLAFLPVLFVLLAQTAYVYRPAVARVAETMRNLTREKIRAQTALKRLTNFSRIAADLFWEVDAEGRITYIEGEFLKVLQGGRQSIVGCRYLDLLELREGDDKALWTALAAQKPYSGIVSAFVDADGTRYILEVTGAPRFDALGQLVGYYGTANDVTDRVAEQENVIRLAHTDPLTGLGNKRALEVHLGEAFADCGPDKRVALIAIDLDGFKAINDTHGHAVGDETLKQVAERICAETRMEDVPVRVGGDEFAIICRDVERDQTVTRLAMRLRRSLSAPYDLSVATELMSASIGIAYAPEDAADMQNLVRRADEALYAAKAAGRNRIIAYGSVVGGLADLESGAA